MKKLLFNVIAFFQLTHSIAQTVGAPYFDVQGPLYTRENIYTQNKAGTGWVGWATRNTSLSETRIDLENVLSVNKSGGNLGIGNGFPSGKVHVSEWEVI